jgi:hypothetical protein
LRSERFKLRRHVEACFNLIETFLGVGKPAAGDTRQFLDTFADVLAWWPAAPRQFEGRTS